MAVFRKTYQVEEGGTRILDQTIGMGLIYDLSRSGTDLQETEELTDDPPNGYFSYDPNFGYLFFNKDTPFNADEWVTIIYRAVGIPIPPPPEPPPTCENPTVVASVYNVKNIRLKFGAAGDYMIDIIPSSGTCGDAPIVTATISGTDVYVSGPLVAGSYKACVRKNCGGGLLSGQVVSNTVVIVLSQQNFGARKGPSDTRIKITNIIGVLYETRSGSLPLVTAAQEMRGRHEGFAGVQIKVNITVNKKQQVVVGLYKNGPLVQFIPVYMSSAGATFVLFNPISATPSDDIFIALDYT